MLSDAEIINFQKLKNLIFKNKKVAQDSEQINLIFKN